MKNHRVRRALVASLILIGLSGRMTTTAQSGAPAPPLADLLLAAAMKTAAAEHKAIFVDFSASWCGPCHKLDAFLHARETNGIITDHFVLLNLTVLEDKEHKALENPGADVLMAKWGGGNAIPFYVFLDAAGNKIDADLGYPGDKASIKKFMALVDRAAPRLTAANRATLVGYLNEQSSGLGSIAGRILDDQGRPLAKASVSVIDRAYSDGDWKPIQGSHVETNDAGGYVINYLTAGDYRLLVEAPRSSTNAPPADSTTYAATFYPATTSLAEAKVVKLARNQDLVGVDVPLARARTARVSGTAVGSDGQPLSSGSVVLTNLDWPTSTYRASIGADGTFMVPNVSPGRYNVWASCNAPVPPQGGSQESGFLPVDVSGSDIGVLRIVTTPGATLAGTLVLEGGPLSPEDRAALAISAVAVDPVAGAPPGLKQSHVETDGRFELRGVRGSRVIRSTDLPPGWMLKRVTLGGKDVTDTAIDLGGIAQLADLQVLVTSRAAGVTGTAKDAAGQLAKSGAVIVFADDGSRWTYPSRFVKIAPIQPDATFNVAALPAGSYLMVGVDSTPPNWDAPESLERLRARATPLRLAEGERAVVIVTMKPANR